MAAYLIGHITIKDSVEWKKYVDGVKESLIPDIKPHLSDRVPILFNGCIRSGFRLKLTAQFLMGTEDQFFRCLP